MVVDCDRCAVRGDACGGCVITLLLGSRPGDVDLDETERAALDTLAAAGMVPTLRLVEGDVVHRSHGAELPAASRPTINGGGHDERLGGGGKRSSRRVG